MSFDPKSVQQGNLVKKQAEETPTSFATENGASYAEPTGSLDKKNELRMAGPGGAFAMKMICLLYTSPSPRDMRRSRMPSSA